MSPKPQGVAVGLGMLRLWRVALALLSEFV